MVMFVFSDFFLVLTNNIIVKIYIHKLYKMTIKETKDEGSTTSGFQTFKIKETDKKIDDASAEQLTNALKLLQNCQEQINVAIGQTTLGTRYATTAIEKVEEAFKTHDLILEEKQKLGVKTEANKTKYEELEKKLHEFMTKIQLGNDIYDYIGESKNHFGTTYKVLNGYGIHMKTTSKTSAEFKENIRSHRATYSCMGYFDSSKTGNGMERLKDGHYYVGKFEGGRRAGGAYVIDQSTKYIGEFRTESFNGFGCFYENGSYLFSKFAAHNYGPVKDKIQYPLIYITSNNSDVRYYIKDGEYYEFKEADKENILNKVKQIEIKGTFDTLNFYQEQYRNLENIVSENKIKIKIGLAVGAFVLGVLAFKKLKSKWDNYWQSYGEGIDKRMRGESSSKEQPVVTASAAPQPNPEPVDKSEKVSHSSAEVKEESSSIKSERVLTPPYYNAKLLKGKKKNQLLEIGKGFGLSEETLRSKTNKQIENAIIIAQRTAKRVQKSNRKITSRRRSSSISRR
jgi:PHD/YefM family antitoxin component YafN of YafNO toxin-antitoxin module